LPPPEEQDAAFSYKSTTLAAAAAAAVLQQRLVRSIFSTGQVPLLQQGDSQALAGAREFVVR
jgi:hypothetical protein